MHMYDLWECKNLFLFLLSFIINNIYATSLNQIGLQFNSTQLRLSLVPTWQLPRLLTLTQSHVMKFQWFSGADSCYCCCCWYHYRHAWLVVVENAIIINKLSPRRNSSFWTGINNKNIGVLENPVALGPRFHVLWRGSPRRRAW